MKNGFDQSSTYFSVNLKSFDIPNIFIHGVGLNINMWLPQVKYFKNKSTIFYDLLNHGKSKKGYQKFDFDNFSYQLIKLTSFLNIEKFNLIGFSLGSLIAQHFASKYFDKINKLIIIASVYNRSLQQNNNINKRYKMYLDGKKQTDVTLKRWFNTKYLNDNPEIYNFFYKILENNKIDNFLPAYKLFLDSDKYTLDFSNLIMPTLIITGAKETGSTPNMSRILNKKIKNSELYIVPNAKHLVTYEKAKLVNNKINNFIS